MAEEKDTDSAPDDGVTESDAVAPSPRHGIGPTTPEAPESLDEQDTIDSADGASAEHGSDEEELGADERGEPAEGEPEVPEELRDAESAGSPATADVEDSDEGRNGDSDDDRELVGVGAAAKSRQAGSRSGGQLAKPTGRVKKDKPTPKQRAEADKPKRTTPMEFVRGAISELKKVVYPTGSQLANYFVVVLVFVLLVIAIVTALDYGFGWAMLKVFS